ncbi:heterokaryon incompatibility protein-domain-containing protein [Xylaria cubensis]|nr:heterokaryon incompatibility protein-domain-containing protein [Xylaria cubensis]
MTGIGAILPVRPHYREGDCGSDIDNNGSVSEGNLKVPRYAYARPVTPLIHTRLLQQWIASCITEHHKCCETRFSTPLSLANIRLIDVRKRQLIVHDTSCRYIALSYVWGPKTTGLLTRATLETFSREGSLGHGDLPRTICDAISLVADLGERYLWVDSLCIIQDDHSDKRQYLPMMGEIYNTAMMVVVAAVENAHSGLPGRGDYKRQQPRMTETIQGIDFTLGQPELWDYLPTTIWSTRGWTYQEAQLARRTLFITDSQVYWSCCEAYWCEDRFTEFPTQPRTSLVNPLLTYIRMVPSIRGNYPMPPILCLLGEYCQKATEFSSRSVSDKGDIFWAFFGILKSLLSRFPKGYIWGLPKEKLDSALLWRTNTSCELCKSLIVPSEKGEWQEVIMPSWCWISKGTEVWYDECYESVESMVEWHEPVRPLTGSQEEGDKEEKKPGNLQSAIFLSDHMSQESALFDYALLHFTTESAIFRMHTFRAFGPGNHFCSMGRATLSLLSGKDIGFIWLPVAEFFVKDEIQGEFILLSSMPFEAQSAKRESKEPTNLLKECLGLRSQNLFGMNANGRGKR